MVLESHPPHKIVNLLFAITNLNNKLMVCGELDSLQLINKNIVSDKARRSRPEMAPDLISHKVFIKSFCKSQFPHKSVNVLFLSVIIRD